MRTTFVSFREMIKYFWFFKGGDCMIAWLHDCNSAVRTWYHQYFHEPLKMIYLLDVNLSQGKKPDPRNNLLIILDLNYYFLIKISRAFSKTCLCFQWIFKAFFIIRQIASLKETYPSVNQSIMLNLKNARMPNYSLAHLSMTTL